MKHFPFFKQLDSMDCGPTCLRMIANYYGKHYSLQTLRERSALSKSGSHLLGLSEAAESIGFRTTGVKITLTQLTEEAPLPCILHWKQRHFVVCYDIKTSKKHGAVIYIADPAAGLLTYTEDELVENWISATTGNEDIGIALLLKPSPDFFKTEDEKKFVQSGFSSLLNYFKPYRKHLTQLFIGILVVSILQLILPFLTQAIVDIGIRDGNLNFIKLVLIAQIVLFIARLSVEFIRSWILLHINTRVNISLISDFLLKIMKLPLHFFDTKSIGDILQRIGDHRRIETFLTGNSVSLLFSFVNFFVFAIVLGYYQLSVLGLFLLGNALYVTYVLLFMNYRRKLDHKRFAQASVEQNNLIQMIYGMPDIKLGNCEKQKRWQWEQIQVKLFKINVKGLAIGQIQQVGSVFFSQLTNIIITFIAAKAVVSGELTIGMMMSITYIIGQLSAPIDQFIGFAQSFQDAKISLERLNEVQAKEDEDQLSTTTMAELPQHTSINLNQLSFSYEGKDRDYVLDNLNLEIPEGKMTAIVGASGSGKTTLVKLMLGFYQPNKGTIKVGNYSLNQINPHFWRSQTGSVLQDGYIFSDTIAGNIALGADLIDMVNLRYAASVANIQEFIESLPLGYNTKIGVDGQGLSQGQRQRILIARAVYKNPGFLFFDEATNALDASNEKTIMNNLMAFCTGKTVIVVAHRLSTVKDADKIVVLDHGKIVEEGDHHSLTKRQGLYYQLVKNQLELGN
ncbi:MAG: peptidase domain-containing ABC transporter [Bacteroidota bacterium]|nr:peptidase domain-containing ABC transporter [Bacteroidota bacterium]